MGIGDLLVETFKKVWDYIRSFADDFVKVIERGIVKVIEGFEKDVAEDWDKIFPKELRELPLFKEYEKYVKEQAGKKQAVAGIIINSLIGGAIGTGIGMGAGGIGENIRCWFNRQLTPRPLPPDITAYAFNREAIDKEKKEWMLKSEGFKDDLHWILIDYYKPKLTLSELATAYLRGVITKEEFEHRLSEHGFSKKEIEWLSSIIWDYPSPTDFIRFAVRDVFTKDEKLKEALMSEFPEDIVDKAEKAGLKREHLLWYWMAHWVLPSPTQVYEMLHRLNPDVLTVRGDAYKEMGLDLDKLRLTLDDVKDYLRQADYDVRWRERLVAISYSPLTRVDLRRIYQLGLINDEELLARLMEIGYTKADALKLLEFYKSLKVEAEKDLTRSQILDLWEIGEITEKECKEMLMSIGYDDAEAEFLIALEKHKQAEKELRDKIAVLVYQFEEGLITEQQLTEKLDELGLKASRRDKVVMEAVRRRQRKIRLPSKEDIVRWFERGLITEEKARELLSRLNIPEEFHDLYLSKKK